MRTHGGRPSLSLRATTRRWLIAPLFVSFLALAVLPIRAADEVWNFAVEISASVSASPPQISLTWPEDTWAMNGYKPSYSVRRKAPDATSWGTPIDLGGGATSYTDTNVQVGVAYEYEVIRNFKDPSAPEHDHIGSGYVVSGIGVPATDHHGRVILVVEDRIASNLSAKVATLQADLVGDGWTVTTLVVSAGDAPRDVRQRVANEYWSGAEQPRVLFLLGHIPVVKSGSTWVEYISSDSPNGQATAPDGHDPRPLSCDAYYGDVDGSWTDANGDGVFENDSIPSDVEMGVGRVDFANLPSLGADDLALTARYLDKDHAFRSGALRFERRALIGDRTGIDYKRAPAGGAYRNFSAFYGPSNILTTPTEDNTPDSQRWIARIRSESYGWAYGSGGGSANSAAFLGTNGPYRDVTSQDMAGDTHVGFYLMFGSMFDDWSQTDNLLRSALASPTGGLGAAWTGRPTFILHRMALGEPVGFGVRLTQNNDGNLYYSPSNAFRRSVHIAWLGDPTLRLEYPAPPTNVGGNRSGSSVALAWQRPADASDATRYVVYRAASDAGPFTRLTATALSNTSFTDDSSPSNSTYLVRAIRDDQTASGSYENPSTGVRWTSGGASEYNPPPSSPPPSAGPGFVNLSTRVRLSANAPAIVGFVVAGSAPRQMLLRAAGPSLSAFGLNNHVDDPQIQLSEAQGKPVATNTGWGDDGQIAAAARSVGAFAFNSGSRDAALLVTLQPGSYTAQVRASNSGTALLEAYAVDVATAPLTNISTRGLVGAADDALVAGFIVGGNSTARVLVRAVGPGLSAFNVSGALANPVLTVYRQQAVLARNDDWETPIRDAAVPISTTPGEIATANNSVGAFSLQPGSRDSAVVVTLDPGGYTAIITGAGGATGTALIEVYQLP